ncbi:MAG: carboxylating nicotinate-nucleotide diphosphorylase [Sedimentisphaerales bacterium]|jgi:nicotinate-nucleotide pyrophosphorylase (carboxylating)|nr:carboxylating nicotinate-nucleotide diphosphorylase [Planctomycetota bacterium]MDY0354749.1 carboxylating nicotinate-nucleotide diphosphorylase [Sedimentisphaerales bacterium]NLT76798.1 carboxylating nicotinate-nucleotide diphosphorylase [Planctomycetota bacterium]
MKKLNIAQVRPLIQMAIEEDLGRGDVTTELLFPDDSTAKATIVSREEIVVCGIPVLEEILRQYDPRLKLTAHVRDGQSSHVGSKLATIEGPLRGMLSAERVVLNFLQRLSGIATTTSKYVRAIRGTKAKIYDTRKTLPGWRLLEKYAVRCGGGYNHRLGLYDGILIKDNHVAELGKNFPARLRRVVDDARNIKGLEFVAVEVDHVDHQLNHVLKIPGIDIVLLDNMGQWQLKHAVEMRDEMCGKGNKPLLEASGNITLDNVSAIAQCGVDRIAIGAITHSATAVDIGLDK